jgi:TatD DNase family protein
MLTHGLPVFIMPVTLIDTHAHLDDERFATDFPDVIQRAKDAGLARIVVVATTLPSSRTCVELAKRFPMLAPSAGIHPNHFAEAGPGDWDEVARMVRERRVVAIGETGLDRHWDFTPFARQEENFARHLGLSRETRLPLIIHSRDCDEDMLRMLRDDFNQNGPLRGVMHSFASVAATAEACLAMGLYFSFAGMLTYKNAGDLRSVAATIPADRVMVETDCPYLSPVPLRGKRNEPAHVVHTAQCLANVRGVSLETLAEQTTANARRLFNLND